MRNFTEDPSSTSATQDDTPKMSLRGACDMVIWIDLASALINGIAALHFIPLTMTESDTRNDKVYISEL